MPDESAGDLVAEPRPPPAVRSPRRKVPVTAAEPRARAELPALAEAVQPSPPATVPAPAAATLSVAEQLDVLRRARQALRGGAPAQALQLLDGEQQALESGEFAAEARLLRIEALAGAHRQAEASALAREFVRRFPPDQPGLCRELRRLREPALESDDVGRLQGRAAANRVRGVCACGGGMP